MAQDPFEMQLFFHSYAPSISYMISVGNSNPPFEKKKDFLQPYSWRKWIDQVVKFNDLLSIK